jgi:hypothetical protein
MVPEFQKVRKQRYSSDSFDVRATEKVEGSVWVWPYAALSCDYMMDRYGWRTDETERARCFTSRFHVTNNRRYLADRLFFVKQ